MKKRWVLKGQGDQAQVKALAEALGIDQHLSNLLVQRGIFTYDEAKAFFRPRLEDLHDPFLMKDMEKAVKRIEKAVSDNERILVYGDYDVDGTTAVALVYTFLRNFHDRLDFYIPDRYEEGYGISYKSIDYAAENGFSLVIVLDCGIKAVEKIAYAKSRNIDYIIADHHRPGESLPKAVAVLDPKQPDCPYPYHELSGCGVGFKLIQAYASRNDIPFESLKEYLDLLVVSIASDIVHITGENRILAHFGLHLVNTNPRPGIEAILNCSGITRRNGPSAERSDSVFSKKLTISDLVFLVGPRINAAGRIESARNSVELLVTRDIETARMLAEQINDFNNQRKDLDSHTTQEAMTMIQEDTSFSQSRSTIIYNPNWHKGVIGIVASRLIDYFYRPTIVLTRSNGLITGSARSIKDFDIYDAIDHCSDLLEHFGGHTYAAGLSLKPENLPLFRARFEQYVRDHLEDKMLTPEVEIDTILCLNQISKKFFRILKQFAPFGPGNMIPIFRTDNVVDTGYARIVGKKHIKFEVVHPDIRGYPVPAIAFQQSDQLEQMLNSHPFSICYHLEENEWNGQVTLQLNIKDIKTIGHTEISDEWPATTAESSLNQLL
ncbi:MAG: single-stranded-DNA-specific exonuclease RecJ [Bacteroidales bacterium]|nr:single-stranded-DNA-specific exonuclease RecJ [Bacteroidales bacterium]